MGTPSAATPIAFIRSVTGAYERYGLDPAAALRAANIPVELVRTPNAWVTADQMQVFSGHAMRELDDEALGWFSRRFPWGTNGLLCRASLPSADLGIALERWCRHYGLLTDDVRLDMAVDALGVRLTIREQVDLGAQREFCLISVLRAIHGYACWLIDSRIPLSCASFPYARPSHGSCYPLMFRGPIRFDAQRAGLEFDPQYLKLPVRRDDRELRILLANALPLIVLQYRRDRLLSRQIRKFIGARTSDMITAEDVAAALHLSTRSLYRHLAEEGTSLQALKDQIRRDRAVEQLTRTDRSLKQVAAASGFRNEASFSRAFRQWTGQSPGDFRQSRVRSAP